MGALCTRCLRPSLAGMQYETLRNEMDMTDLQTVMSYNLGLSSTDITQLIDNEDNKNKLLDILPTYLSYKTKLSRCEDAKETCVDHLRDIVQTEQHKLQFIVNSLEIIMFKIAMGNLEVSDTQIEALATKYATDQTTISDLEKSLRVIDEDKRCSFTLVNSNVASEATAALEESEEEEGDDVRRVVAVTNSNHKKSAVTTNVCGGGAGCCPSSSPSPSGVLKTRRCADSSSSVVVAAAVATESPPERRKHRPQQQAVIIDLGEEHEEKQGSSSSSPGRSATAPTAMPVTVLTSSSSNTTDHTTTIHHQNRTPTTTTTPNNGTGVTSAKKKVSFSKIIVEDSGETIDLPDVPDTEPAILQLSSPSSNGGATSTSSTSSSKSPKSHHQRERPLLVPC
ncbi:protein U44 [Elephant endotheliotropic herpesvirus 3A]|uniref:Tegument protein UL51 homolog n=1 Tax=Elephant endotheliotropic herpesvirus 3A TaxID=1329409 RepID=A0A866VSL7_9BETA|nr:protein U44 [Elephant endotheliotropic herpesvirus 3A]QOE74417.1 protein U44 [Elephant endotheliotropic herpesvirus 3A]